MNFINEFTEFKYIYERMDPKVKEFLQDMERYYSQGDEENAYKNFLKAIEYEPSLLFIGLKSQRKVMPGEGTLKDVKELLKKGFSNSK